MKVGALACGVALAVAASAPTQSVAAPARIEAATCGKLLEPPAGTYFGAAPDFVSNPRRLEGDSVSTEAIDRFERSAGRKPVFAEMSQHWFMGLEFPRDKVLTIWRHGQVPYVRMMPHAGSPYGSGNPPEQFPGDYSLQNVIEGKFDAPLRDWAAAARDTNIPFLLEFGVEENNEWGPWAGDWNGAGTTTGYGDPGFPDGPERFRAAYRHVVTLFREQGATNVTWFFHVDTWWAPRVAWATYANYYPGDDLVDWLALSVYGWNDWQTGLPTGFEDKLQNAHAPDYPGSYVDVTSLGPKPVAITELGIPEGPQKPRWISDAFAALTTGRYPRIKAIAWWDSSDVNTRIDSSPASQQAFQTAATHSSFDAKPQFSGNCLPPTPKRLTARRSGPRVTLTWATMSNATAFEVWRGARRVATTTEPTFTDRVAARSAYRIRAINPLGVGAFSLTARR